MGAQRELPARRAGAELLSLPDPRPASAAVSARAAALCVFAVVAPCVLTPAAIARSARSAAAAPSTPPAAATHAAAWSAPTALGACAAAETPRATFPRDKPTHATGKGAIVWPTTGSCAAGGTLISTIAANDVPGPPTPLRSPDGARLTLRPPLALAPAPHGRLAIADSAPATGGSGQLVQGSAGGPFATLGTIAGAASQNALATGYLGDLAAASPTGGGSGRAGVRVDVERYFAGTLSPSRIVAAQPGALSALTVSLDFRTDAIVAWRQKGALYAHDLPGSERAQPTQRLASVGPAPRIAALISDDNRAIVAWADQRGAATSIYLDASAGGVRFGAPRLLEHFTDPSGLPYPATSPRLVRLSSESVMIAWTGAQHGHWVVRTAAIDLNGLGRIATVSDPAADSLLSDLQPGPDGEALALWSEPQPKPDGGLDTRRQALLPRAASTPFPTGPSSARPSRSRRRAPTTTPRWPSTPTATAR